MEQIVEAEAKRIATKLIEMGVSDVFHFGNTVQIGNPQNGFRYIKLYPNAPVYQCMYARIRLPGQCDVIHAYARIDGTNVHWNCCPTELI